MIQIPRIPPVVFWAIVATTVIAGITATTSFLVTRKLKAALINDPTLSKKKKKSNKVQVITLEKKKSKRNGPVQVSIEPNDDTTTTPATPTNPVATTVLVPEVMTA